MKSYFRKRSQKGFCEKMAFENTAAVGEEACRQRKEQCTGPATDRNVPGRTTEQGGQCYWTRVRGGKSMKT